MRNLIILLLFALAESLYQAMPPDELIPPDDVHVASKKAVPPVNPPWPYGTAADVEEEVAAAEGAEAKVAAKAPDFGAAQKVLPPDEVHVASKKAVPPVNPPWPYGTAADEDAAAEAAEAKVAKKTAPPAYGAQAMPPDESFAGEDAEVEGAKQKISNRQGNTAAVPPGAPGNPYLGQAVPPDESFEGEDAEVEGAKAKVAAKKTSPPPGYDGQAMPPDESFAGEDAEVEGAKQKISNRQGNTAAVPPGTPGNPYLGQAGPPDESFEGEGAEVEGAKAKVAAKKTSPPPGYDGQAVPPDESFAGEDAEVEGAEAKVAAKALPPDFGVSQKALPPDEVHVASTKFARHANIQEAAVEFMEVHSAGRSHLAYFSIAALVAVIALVGVIVIALKSRKSPSTSSSQIPLTQVHLDLV